MAGSARYTAILDACVLYPAAIRDLLLSLAHVGLFHARWSAQIQREWVQNLRANRPDVPQAALDRTVDLMAQAVPDSLVTGYEGFIANLQLPDPDNRHVLTAAIAGHADAIFTFNLKDFPRDVLVPFDIEAQHPDDFIMNQFELHELAAVAAVKRMRGRLRNLQMAVGSFVDHLERLNLPQTAACLRGDVIQSLI